MSESHPETVNPAFVTTQYPGGEPLVLTAPANQPIGAFSLINASPAIANLQAQITALAARVTALEQAQASEPTGATGGTA